MNNSLKQIAKCMFKKKGLDFTTKLQTLRLEKQIFDNTF